ncbi:Amidase family protein [Coniochaeta hoffmannii]|uniref:Amidase family protein n=1 Tax=Coniochaeta hoffmannii TaxID=91930 RepID=A0AA38S245_9PEZI|nr:Amidase family protein [Coniochaeta hoffmannii]
MPFDALTLQTATAVQLQSDLSSGRITSVQLVSACLSNIEKYDGYLHAVICSAPHERVIRAAALLDDERAAGKVRGPLHGIPVLVKDNIATQPDLGMETTAGSVALVGSRPRRNADVVQRLIDAGAIVIAKANLSELSYFKRTAKARAGWSPVGGQTQSAYVRGGIQEEDTVAGHSNPGGSSSGSAVGVSAGYAPLALGTETHGSLILPANRAALYALKPTVGLISATGIVPISRVCDSAGPMAKSAADLAILLDVLVDAAKPTVPKGGYTAAVTTSWKGLRIGTLDPDAWMFSEELRKPVEEADAEMIRDIRDARFTIGEKGVLSQIFQATFQAELEGYLADLEASKVRTLAELIQFNKDHSDVELPEEYPDQEFLTSSLDKALPGSTLEDLIAQLRRLGRDEGIDQVFRDYDINILVGPVESQISLFAAAAGYPIASLPLGYLHYNGRPHGLAAIASANHEADLIQLMSAWEATRPARQPPSLSLK